MSHKHTHTHNYIYIYIKWGLLVHPARPLGPGLILLSGPTDAVDRTIAWGVSIWRRDTEVTSQTAAGSLAGCSSTQCRSHTLDQLNPFPVVKSTFPC